MPTKGIIFKDLLTFLKGRLNFSNLNFVNLFNFASFRVEFYWYFFRRVSPRGADFWSLLNLNVLLIYARSKKTFLQDKNVKNLFLKVFYPH